MKMPEEINRILTDQISSTLFCPTKTAIKNLADEGFGEKECNIYNVGDVMYDAALFYAPNKRKPTQLKEVSSKFALVTIHRAENTDCLDRLENIVDALNHLNRDIQVICPIHPRTRQIIKSNKLKVDFTMLDPVGYFEMIWLLKNSSIVLTDSGGLQKEAYFFNKPCLTMRVETEWVELIEIGANALVGANRERIIIEARGALKIKFTAQPNIYGDGDAAKKIVELLV